MFLLGLLPLLRCLLLRLDLDLLKLFKILGPLVGGVLTASTLGAWSLGVSKLLCSTSFTAYFVAGFGCF
jgi:uncharacterized protein (DUF697 family)